MRAGMIMLACALSVLAAHAANAQTKARRHSAALSYSPPNPKLKHGVHTPFRSNARPVVDYKRARNNETTVRGRAGATSRYRYQVTLAGKDRAYVKVWDGAKHKPRIKRYLGGKVRTFHSPPKTGDVRSWTVDLKTGVVQDHHGRHAVKNPKLAHDILQRAVGTQGLVEHLTTTANRPTEHEVNARMRQRGNLARWKHKTYGPQKSFRGDLY